MWHSYVNGLQCSLQDPLQTVRLEVPLVLCYYGMMVQSCHAASDVKFAAPGFPMLKPSALRGSAIAGHAIPVSWCDVSDVSVQSF